MKKIYWSFLITTLVSSVFVLMFSIFRLYLLLNISSVVMLVSLMVAIVIYFGFVKFQCTKCKTVFRSNFLEIFFAMHTPTKRRMTCPLCKEKVWCCDVFEKVKKESKEDNENT